VAISGTGTECAAAETTQTVSLTVEVQGAPPISFGF
jgi:hypothetical protein